MLASCVERLCRAYIEHSLDFFTKTMRKSKKHKKRAITLQRQVRRKRKKIWVLLIFILIPHIKFQDLSLTVCDCMQA